MPFLRVMTFNMQLLPEIEVPVFKIPLMPKSGNESKEKAGIIGDAIAALPPDELPDVLIGNEVVHEGARQELIQRLSPLYGNIIPIFEDPAWLGVMSAINPAVAALFQDSGLFFASRWPIVPLPDGSPFRFARYSDATGWDAFWAKGVGIVGISCPLGAVIFAFTHTQAAYDFEDEYRDIRAKQLAQIETELDLAFGVPSSAWRDPVVLGDLNIRGDTGAVSNEWSATFGTGSAAFVTALRDGWRTYMRPPTSPIEVDPGFTNNNLEPGKDGAMPAGLLMRFDYILTRTPATGELVPQQMRTRFRTLSDHWSLEADLHRISPACTPSTAVLFATIPALASGLRIVPLNIAFDGSYQWLFVDEPGTYTIFPPVVPVETSLFSEDDLTTPRKPYAQVDANKMGLSQLVGDLEQEGPVTSPMGEQFELPGPFFIRVRARVRTGGYTGPCMLGVFRHRGETCHSAIRLRPFATLLDPLLPVGQPLGAGDVCWFRADLDRAHSAETHTSVFELHNATGANVNLELLLVECSALDNPSAPPPVLLGNASGLGPLLELTHATVGPETVYLLLRRSSLTQTKFLLGWRSGLTYLRSDPKRRPLVLRCPDETGPDWLGADEITLKLRADGMLAYFLDEYWGDADTNEILKLEDKVPPLAFVAKIEIWLNEADFIQSQASITTISALGPSEAPTREVLHDISVQSGKYRFEGVLSRWSD